jgi:AmmeMemoRadiSam system protein B
MREVDQAGGLAMIRRAAMAGSFYAGTRERLKNELLDLLEPDAPKAPALGAVAPHAGYMYSGHVAGAVYSRIPVPESVVILGPNHTGLGAGAAIMTEGTWETPLGQVPLDTVLGRAIREASQALEEDELGHRREHSIEVQLPFLQARETPFSLVPICLFSQELSVCQDVGRAIAAGVRATGRRALVVASTDMSHYISHEAATARDRKAIDAILALDPEGLYQTVRKERITMCGFAPTTAMLLAAKALGATRAELVRYMTSGDVNKEYDRVVGYAGILVR